MTKIRLVDHQTYIGELEMWDAEPSFETLQLAYPGACVVYEINEDIWTVNLASEPKK